MIQEEDAEGAVKRLCGFLNDRDNVHVWLKLAYAYQVLGEVTAARAILRNVVLKKSEPHIVDIVAARIPFAKPIVVDDFKLLYYSIPKCGSSSIKDALIFATGGELRGETSHFHISHMAKVLSFKNIDDKYADYESIAVIRHPRARLRSYWNKNIRDGSLEREAGNKRTFYGLSTSPNYDDILSDFHNYRNVFRDFRHHTDTIVGYLGRNPSRVRNIFDISQLPSTMNLIETVSGRKIPTIRNMRSERLFGEIPSSTAGQEAEILDSFYAEELNLYFKAEKAVQNDLA